MTKDKKTWMDKKKKKQTNINKQIKMKFKHTRTKKDLSFDAIQSQKQSSKALRSILIPHRMSN